MTAAGAGFWIGIALRFLIRSGRSTAALAAMVVTAVAALIFLSALAVGVKDAMLRNTVGLFSGHISAENLPASMTRRDLDAPGVAAVLKRVPLAGTLSRGGRSQALVLCGIDPAREAETTALGRKITAGGYPRSGRNEILISDDTAAALAAEVGDRLRFSSPEHGVDLVLSVAGRYHTGLDTLDRGFAFAPLDRLPVAALPWSAAVFLDTGVDAGTVLERYRQRLPAQIRLTSWSSRMPDLRQLIDLEAVSMAIVILLVFGVVAIGIACSFVIFIIRNMREYGILKAMGVSRAEMAGLITAKVMLMNGLACSTGIVVGVLSVLAVSGAGGIDISALTSHNRYFAVSGVILPRLTAFSLWAPPATAMLFGLLAALWPAAMVARKRAADILRMI